MRLKEKEVVKFFEFMLERQRIYQNKEVKLLPREQWTKDETLSKFLFCNVFRMQDGGTRELYERILSNPDLSIEDKILNTVFYRFISNRNIFNIVEGPMRCSDWDLKFYEKKLDEAKSESPLYGNAYLVQGKPQNEYRTKCKHVHQLFTLDAIRKDLTTGDLKHRLKNAKSGKEVLDVLCSYNNIGPFIAYQIFLDLSYLEGVIPFSDDDFVIVGPGVWQSLNSFVNRPVNEASAIKLMYILRDNQDKYFELTGCKEEWDSIKLRNLTVGDVEFALCEYRKYINLSKGVGKKRYYKNDKA